jgi:hypothetical protein
MGTVMIKDRKTEQLMLNIWARKLLDECQPSPFDKLFPRKPLTRMQKIRRRLSIYGERISNAWDALRGIDRGY